MVIRAVPTKSSRCRVNQLGLVKGLTTQKCSKQKNEQMNSRKVEKILITGEAGFIGLAVVRQFINETDITVVTVC